MDFESNAQKARTNHCALVEVPHIQQRQPKDYERAVILLMDLHDLAVRQEDETGFQLTMEELRKTHGAKGAFLRRLAKANL